MFSFKSHAHFPFLSYTKHPTLHPSILYQLFRICISITKERCLPILMSVPFYLVPTHQIHLKTPRFPGRRNLTPPPPDSCVYKTTTSFLHQLTTRFPFPPPKTPFDQRYFHRLFRSFIPMIAQQLFHSYKLLFYLKILQTFLQSPPPQAPF